ncbi:MAG: FG-GAP-like repeat-containing protein [Chloroflexota bacterium]
MQNTVSLLVRQRAIPRFLVPISIGLFGLLLLFTTLEYASANKPAQDGLGESYSVTAVSANLQTANQYPYNTIATQLIETNASRAIKAGDVDGDGDLDLAIANNNNQNQILLNENGNFETVGWQDSRSDFSRDIQLGDIDGDGDLDLIVANNNGATRVYSNDPLNEDGSLNFNLIWTESVSDDTRSLALGDLDGNGYMDLVIANWEAENKVYLNSGGTFSSTPDWSDGNNYLTSSVDVADIDGDGDLDAAFGSMCPSYPSNCDPDQVFQNNSTTSLVLSLVWERNGRSTTDIAFGEMNGDDQAELAMVENVYNSHKVYQFNTSNLEFDFVWNSITENDLGLEVSWGDANGDGNQDLIVGSSFDAPERLYLNNGSILETSASWNSDDTITNQDFIHADIDADGDLDLIGAFDNLLKIYTNKSHPINDVAISIPLQSVYETRDVVWGDVNGDGLLDLVEANDSGNPNQVYLNDGAGFLSLTTPELGGENSEGAALGDVDFDGDLDLAIANNGSPNQIYFNDGTGFNNSDVQELGTNEKSYDVAWADMDGDGDLDLITANDDSPNLLYVNVFTNQGLGNETISLGTTDDETRAVAWGDIDQDGDLDLAFANANQPNIIYINDNGTFSDGNAFTIGANENSVDIAWGDVDNDGDLDLAVANQLAPNQIFCNEGGLIGVEPCWSSLDTNDTRSLAWGDADGDGDLDLAVGNARGNSGGAVEPDKIYFNENGTLQTAAQSIWTSDKGTEGWLSTFAVAWGDVDQDGDLDLATGGRSILGNAVSGSSNGRTRVFFNDQYQGMAQTDGGPVKSVSIDLYSSLIQRNQNNSTNALANADFFANPGIRDGESVEINYTLYHPTGANARLVRGFYSLDGGGQWFEAIPTPATDVTDLATAPYPTQNSNNQHLFTWNVIESGFFGQSDNVIFRFEVQYDGAQPSGNTAVGTYLYTNSKPDGSLQPSASTQTFPIRVRGNQVKVLDGDSSFGISEAIVYQLPSGQITGADPIADSNGIPFETNNLGFLQGRGVLLPGEQLVAMKPVDYGGIAPIGLSFDGSDDFVNFDVVSETAVLENNFTVSAWIRPVRVQGLQYILSHGNTNSDNGFGLALLNDGLRFSTFGVQSYDTQNVSILAGEWVHVAAVLDNNNDVSFYVNGVYQETVTGDAPALPNDDDPLLLGGNRFFSNLSFSQQFSGVINEVRIWQEARTASHLQLELNQSLPESDGDDLLAYWPIFEGQNGLIEDYSDNNNHGQLGGLPASFNPNWSPAWITVVPQNPTYIVYNTSAAPSESGLDMHTVPNTLGIIQLRIRSENTLTLYDLDVSLEWDARNDPSYMEQLSADIERASQIVFDLTDGQAAFGDVRIFHDKENWFDADVIIYASNNHRPNANLGGLVQEIASESVGGQTYDEAYIPGQIRMGSVWNRFGNTNGTLGEDWPRALAHEFGHYAFYLLDNYLGINNNLLIETNCSGSAMTDAYFYSELLTRSEWLGECGLTIAEFTTGRTDWETLTNFYPWMTEANALDGPSSLPINVTQVSYSNIEGDSETLASPFFGLLDDANVPLVFDESDAQAYLFKMGGNGSTPTDVIHLGAPNRDLVQARGAEPGDQVCVYGRSFTFVGCHTVGSQEAPFTVHEVANWKPEITVTPVTSKTIRLTVVNIAPVSNLTAQFIPMLGVPIGDIVLTAVPGQINTYEALLEFDTPTPGGSVRFQVGGTSPQLEAMTHFFLGSGWNINRPGFSINRPGFSINRPGFSINRPGFSINRPGFSAPMSSSDGQVIIFSIENIFTDAATYSLQSLTSPPDLDDWLAPVGQAYRFNSQGDLPDSSITFYYLQRDVPGSFENDINVYYRAEGSSEWERLTTELDTYRNFASAPLMGEGTYLLAVTIVTPELQQGWNLFAYPNTNERPLPNALASIHDSYTSIYELQGNVWKLYDTTVQPGFETIVNDLDSVQPLHTYWIYAISDTTPFIGIPDNLVTSNANSFFSLPPATFYGEVTTDGPEIPTNGTVVAAIDGNICGQATLIPNGNDSWVYKIKVAADVGNDCGVNGRSIEFTIDGYPTATLSTWNNSQAQYWPLTMMEEGDEPDPPPPDDPPPTTQTEHTIFLPLVLR